MKFLKIIFFVINRLTYYQDISFKSCFTFLDDETVRSEFEFSVDQGKIIGGASVVTRNHWPWMVSVGNFCGGVLIGSKWVLTAGHCCSEDSDLLTENVYMGHLNRFDLENRVSVPISSYRVHKGFNSTSLDNDFCLIKLVKSVEYSDKIQPGCLPDGSENSPEAGSAAYIAGWGKVRYIFIAKMFVKYI
jgi:secreted trypsin-like serine protease